MLIPCAGYVQAGFPSPASDFSEEPIDLAKELVSNEAATYYFRVNGESMLDAFMPVGAILVVDRSLPYQNGTIVVAVVDGEFTVKRYEKRLGKERLLPENKRFKPIEIHEYTDFKVWGVVKHIVINAKTV